MTERWQQELGRLDLLEPTPGLLARAQAGPRFPTPGMRPASRVAIVAIALALAAAAIAGVVTTFRSAERQRPASVGIDARTVAHLRLLWHASTGGSATTPVVDGETVYVGGADGYIHAFDASCVRACSAQLWMANAGGNGTDPPSVAAADGVAYAAGTTLYAYPEDCPPKCAPLWTAEIGGNGKPALTLGEGKVFVEATQGRHTARLMAFQPGCGNGGATCQPVWTANIGRSSGPISVADGVVYVSHGGSPIRAYSTTCAADGARCRPLWVGIPGLDLSFAGTPVIGDGVMYVVSDRGLFAIPEPCDSAKTCSPLWTAPIPDGAYLPTFANGMVYVPSVFQPEVTAYAGRCRSDGGTCDPSWVGTVEGSINWVSVVSGDLVFVASNEGKVFALPTSCGAATCSPLWTGSAGSGAASPPTVANSKLFVGSADGIRAFGPSGTGAHPAGSRSGAVLFYLALVVIAGVFLAIRFRRSVRPPAVPQPPSSPKEVV